MTTAALRGIVLAALLSGFVPPWAAEAQEKAALPPGWVVRVDDPGAEGSVELVGMPPGWHVTTGPAAILYQPSMVARGRYRVEAEFYLFDPRGRREGFGIFVGGKALDGAEAKYLYFVVRGDGRFMITATRGAASSLVPVWKEHPAIVSWDDRPVKEGDHQTARNVLAVEVGADEVVFRVNGDEVARLPLEAFDWDGVVGLRVNEGLNLHVSRLEVVPPRPAAP